jgi:hypothetical protein
LGLAVSILYYVVCLHWLRAPRWKNKTEARAELARLVSEHEKYDYHYWAQRIDQTKRIEFTTSAGTWYQATVQPIWDARPGDVIRVLINIDDGGRGAVHPMNADILVDPPSQSQNSGKRGRRY